MNHPLRIAGVCTERKSGLALPEFKRLDADRLECTLFELKVDASNDVMAFEGYGAVFGNVDSYGDVITKGAFKNSIRESKATGLWPAMLQQHGGWGMTADDMMPIGVWTDMEEDDKGLYLKGTLAPTTRGKEMYTLLKMQPRPAITGLSIGYIPVKFKQRSSPDEPRRTLDEVKLMEISPVTFPANPKARVVAAKSELTIRYAEQALRDVGFSQAEAKALVAGGFKALQGQRDVDDGLGDLAAAAQRLQTIFNP